MTLSPGDGPSVEFTVSVERRPDEKVTLTPQGDEETSHDTLPEGAGTRQVTVSANGQELDKEDVPVDCVTEAIPAATFSAACQTEGGTRVLVHLENDAIAIERHPVLLALFTLLVNGQPRTVDGLFVVVGAGEVRDLILLLAEDSGTYTLEARV